jgi:polyisoprenoid-binding protein YceI
MVGCFGLRKYESSDHTRLNKNAYKALKSDEYENIQYKLSSSILSPEKEGYLLNTIGKLTIAGVTKYIEIDNVHIAVAEDSTITCTGTYNLTMTDYGVEPPSFMFGAMKTGDALTFEYNVVYKKAEESLVFIQEIN